MFNLFKMTAFAHVNQSFKKGNLSAGKFTFIFYLCDLYNFSHFLW